MGCASSAPFMGEGGALGEVKSAAGDLVESGENVLHEMGDAAGKVVHDAIDQVKGAVSNASDGLQTAASHVTGAATAATHSFTEGVKHEASTLMGAAEAPADPLPRNGSDPDACRYIPLKGPDSDVLKMIDDIMDSPQHSPTSEVTPPLEKFKPTPVPSFDKPPTPSATMGSLADILETPMEKIPESAHALNTTIDDLTNELLKETEAVATEVKTSSLSMMKQKLPPIESMTDLMKAETADMDQKLAEAAGSGVVPEIAASEAMEDAIPEAEDKLDTEKLTVAPSTDGGETDETAELEYDLRPTKWEALADAIVELPPRMSIDLGTGQLYAVVVDEEPAGRGPRARVPLKELSAETGLHGAAS